MAYGAALWVLVLGIISGGVLSGQFADASPCPSKIKISKKVLSTSENLYSIPAQNTECLETKNKLHQPICTQFKKSISDKTNTEPFYLIKIQRAIFENGRPEALPIFDMILKGDIGTVRDINILEAFLMTEHLTLNGRKGEFGALILKAKDSSMKIYFSSNTEATAIFSDTIYASLEKDLSNGYTLYGHLHNHPFNFENPYGDIAGTTVPSAPDRSVYKDFKIKYGLKNAYVTNGFSTIAIPDSQFEHLPYD